MHTIINPVNLQPSKNDDFIKMVEYATKAPSGHNSQPWKFKIYSNSIEIHPDLDFSLPVVDAKYRELYISLGGAVENLCLAAQWFGYKAIPSILNDNTVCYILVKLEKIAVEPDSLFEQITKRQTNRSHYDNKIVDKNCIQQILSAGSSADTHCYCYKKKDPLFETLANLVYQGNILQLKDVAFKNELVEWIRFNEKHVKITRNGLSYKVLGSPPMPIWFGKWMVRLVLLPKVQNDSDRKKIKSTSHFMLFTSVSNTPENWINTGRTVERFLLKCTELNIAYSYLNQACEQESLANEMQKLMPIGREYPMLMLRIGYASPKAYSPRKNVDEVLAIPNIHE